MRLRLELHCGMLLVMVVNSSPLLRTKRAEDVATSGCYRTGAFLVGKDPDIAALDSSPDGESPTRILVVLDNSV